LANPPLRKTGPLTILLLVITSIIVTVSFLPRAKAETKILSMTPFSGNVETAVQLRANISTLNGTFEIWFDETFLTSRNAIGSDVNASFTVPHAPSGSHNVTIIDVDAGENDTATFTVLTSYSFEPVVPKSPAQLQEGESVAISVNMTGGKSNYTYPNVNVQTPGNLTYEALDSIATNVAGDFYGNLTYPNDFSSGANTNLTGEHKVLFNETVVNQFFVGLTNLSEYHRGDLVNIKAVDYPLNRNVTIAIKFGDETIDSIPLNVTDGVIDTNWSVPSNATVGNYTLSITPVPDSKKEANDTQIFKIPGFKTEIFTLNLANETVPNVFVRVYDELADKRYNSTSAEDGLASFMLEGGNYRCEASFKEVKVGKINFTIAEEGQAKPVNLTCQLTSMNINVIDAQKASVPFVSISLTYNYTTNLDVTKNRTETEFGETNITGILRLHSLLPKITYTINASRYGEVFNQNNNTVSELSAQDCVYITIFCPVRTLHVNVVDACDQPIINATAKAQELMGGLYYDTTTDDDGKAVLNCTFGRYFVKVYVGEIMLCENKTPVDLCQNQNISISCKLYGLTLSVRVGDYFGQPISNANVTLQREGLSLSPRTTQSDGTATFDNIVGGNLTIRVYLTDQTQPCTIKASLVDESKTIEIKIDKYVILAGFLVETSHLATAIIILATVILIFSIEIYRKKRLKPQKGSKVEL
jgi:hypothetical protein